MALSSASLSSPSGMRRIARTSGHIYPEQASGAGASVVIELHQYQKDFLETLARAQGRPSLSAALQALVELPMSDPQVRAQIFDTFHCVHCKGVSPAEWINTRKGEKLGYSFELSSAAVAFLGETMLVPVERVGDPPIKKVVSGPRRADSSKAARCCLDWAIKKYKAQPDGNINA